MNSLCVPRLGQARDLVVVSLGGEVVDGGAVGPHDGDLPLGSERRVRLKMMRMKLNLNRK